MSAGEEGITSRICQMSSVLASGVYWSVRPRVGEGVGTGIVSVRRREPCGEGCQSKPADEFEVDSAYLRVPEGQGHGRASAVAYFGCEE